MPWRENKTAREKLPEQTNHCIFYCLILITLQIHTTSVQNQLTHQKMDMPKYLSLFVPALEWILSCIAYKATEVVYIMDYYPYSCCHHFLALLSNLRFPMYIQKNTLKDILDKCEKTGNSLLILQCVLSSFKPDCISPRAVEFCFKITTSQDDLFNKVNYSSFQFFNEGTEQSMWNYIYWYTCLCDIFILTSVDRFSRARSSRCCCWTSRKRQVDFAQWRLEIYSENWGCKRELILHNSITKNMIFTTCIFFIQQEYIFCAEVWTTYAAKYFKVSQWYLALYFNFS